MEGVHNLLCNSGLVRTRIWSFGAGMSNITRRRSGLLMVSQAPMFGDYIEAFDSNLPDVVQFTGIAILVLGFSNFIWYVKQ